MGYACPVCEEPQADGEHLANHLAFSAMLGRADHADWLDEHAPDWGDDDPGSLADRVTPRAETIEVPDLEAMEGDLPEPPRSRSRGGLEAAMARQGGQGREPLDSETRRAIEEAREMTRNRREVEGEQEAEPDEPPTDEKG